MFAWDDLRYFLAVARTGNCSRAAARLRVNQSTVSRRIAALEKELNASLFERIPKGLVLRPDGERLFREAEAMEELALQVTRSFTGRSHQPEGTVRVATIEEIATLFLVPALPEFHKRWPGIKIRLVTGTKTLNLAKGEADVSLRLARPTHGDLHARKVGGFGYGVYAARTYLATLDEERLGDLGSLDWILVEDHHPSQLESRWLKRHLPNIDPILKCNGLKTQMAAVSAGLGVSLLPRPMSKLDPELIRLPVDTGEIRRDIWLVVHRDLRKAAMIQAVMDFLASAINRPLMPTFYESAF